MARPKTYYPGINRRLFDLKYFMDEYLDRCITKTGVADPQLSALRALHTAVTTAAIALPEYKELP